MAQRYRLTDEQLEKLLEAGKPTTYLIFGGMAPSSPQDRVNREWQSIAEQLGVVWDSIGDARTGDVHDFMAEPISVATK